MTQAEKLTEARRAAQEAVQAMFRAQVAGTLTDVERLAVRETGAEVRRLEAMPIERRACVLSKEQQRAGVKSPRCPCPGCLGGLREYTQRRSRARAAGRGGR